MSGPPPQDDEQNVHLANEVDDGYILHKLQQNMFVCRIRKQVIDEVLLNTKIMLLHKLKVVLIYSKQEKLLSLQKLALKKFTKQMSALICFTSV